MRFRSEMEGYVTYNRQQILVLRLTAYLHHIVRSRALTLSPFPFSILLNLPVY
jgi:hypothetical protein